MLGVIQPKNGEWRVLLFLNCSWELLEQCTPSSTFHKWCQNWKRSEKSTLSFSTVSLFLNSVGGCLKRASMYWTTSACLRPARFIWLVLLSKMFWRHQSAWRIGARWMNSPIPVVLRCGYLPYYLTPFQSVQQAIYTVEIDCEVLITGLVVSRGVYNRKGSSCCVLLQQSYHSAS